MWQSKLQKQFFKKQLFPKLFLMHHNYSKTFTIGDTFPISFTLLIVILGYLKHKQLDLRPSLKVDTIAPKNWIKKRKIVIL